MGLEEVIMPGITIREAKHEFGSFSNAEVYGFTLDSSSLVTLKSALSEGRARSPVMVAFEGDDVSDKQTVIKAAKAFLIEQGYNIENDKIREELHQELLARAAHNNMVSALEAVIEEKLNEASIDDEDLSVTEESLLMMRAKIRAINESHLSVAEKHQMLIGTVFQETAELYKDSQRVQSVVTEMRNRFFVAEKKKDATHLTKLFSSDDLGKAVKESGMSKEDFSKGFIEELKAHIDFQGELRIAYLDVLVEDFEKNLKFVGTEKNDEGELENRYQYLGKKLPALSGFEKHSHKLLLKEEMPHTTRRYIIEKVQGDLGYDESVCVSDKYRDLKDYRDSAKKLPNADVEQHFEEAKAEWISQKQSAKQDYS